MWPFWRICDFWHQFGSQWSLIVPFLAHFAPLLRFFLPQWTPLGDLGFVNPHGKKNSRILENIINFLEFFSHEGLQDFELLLCPGVPLLGYFRSHLGPQGPL